MSPKDNRVSTLNQVFIWFGAAVSIAEIITGALLAPLGLAKGLLAIIIGHVIGVSILFMAGFIGANSRLSAAESTRISFGEKGSYIFSILNIVQLIGWTAVMIKSGAQAVNGITQSACGISNQYLWSIVIGLLIILWIVIGIKNLSRVNSVVITVLFVLSLLLGYVVFKNYDVSIIYDGTLDFGAAVELNVAMSLSWLPLISDYTRELQKPKSGTVISVLGYFFGSILMFTIGLGATLYAGTSDITTIFLASGLSIAGLVIVVLATVTTTFLDAYSAGVSTVNMTNKINERYAAIIATLIGVVMALFLPMSQYENFLYFIGSVFAPLYAILFADYYVLGKKSISGIPKFNIKNLILWVIGVIIYRLLMSFVTFVGITLPVMILVSILCVIMNKVIKRVMRKGGAHYAKQ